MRYAAELALVRVEGEPAVPGRVRDVALLEQLEHVAVGTVGRGRAAAGRGVGDQVRDRLHRVGLGVADEADRSALDPAGRVEARDRLAASPSTTRPSTFGITPRALVERRVDDGRAVVADGAVDRLHRDVDELAGAAHARPRHHGAVRSKRRPSTRLVAEHRDGGVPEVQVQAAARAGACRGVRQPLRVRSITLSWLLERRRRARASAKSSSARRRCRRRAPRRARAARSG